MPINKLGFAEQMKQLEQIWHMFDTDSDGFISLDEFEQFMANSNTRQIQGVFF